ncbi:type II secretion system protein [Sulfurovum sp.]|uniref:type II secretion system protein n=1 Tax=Sulfurovum sp. TaxID=1969726 RepID=UPI003568DA74
MRKGFTLLELVFVIVIFGILSKFGADILYKIYENYVYSNTFNRLENQSEAAVKQIANRLQYRIKDSTIARDALNGSVEPIGSNTGNEIILEWIGVDIDGWRGTTGNTNPDWSGFIDLQASSIGSLNTPGTQLPTGSGALFFIGSDVDLSSNFGWTGAISDQTAAIHPVTISGTSITSSNGDDFNGTDVYEYYQFSKTAYAVHLDGTDLKFYYEYQPWDGDNIDTPGVRSEALIMENVSSFKFTSIGDILVIQVCVTDANVTGVGDYSVCKEKVVF